MVALELAASSLLSSFRLLRVGGLRLDRPEEAVPMVPHRRGTGLPRHLDVTKLAQVIDAGCVYAAGPAGPGDIDW